MRTRESIFMTAAVAALVMGAGFLGHPCAARAADPHPQNEPQAAPAVVQGQVVTAEATIEKIDEAHGLITLKGPQGKTFDVKAGPDVDLKRLHKGDRVTATYYEEVAVAIDPATKAAPKMVEKTVVRGGVAERQATVTARIVSVDAKNNVVVIATPDGNTQTLKVDDPALQSKLSQLKPGEHFDVTYTQALAVSVVPHK